MKKILFFTCVMAMIATTAFAHDTTKRLGLGFISTSSPIGIRYWFSPKIGLDIGAGINVNDNAGGSGEKATDWAISGGLPINLITIGDRVNLHFLPWVQYSNIDLIDDTASQFDIVAALEFEVFVTKDLSVSASHGFDFQMYSPPGDADSETDINTFGANITDFGVHYYLPGGGGGGEE
jgi:hypothetical protein